MADSIIAIPSMPSNADVVKIKQYGTPYSLSAYQGHLNDSVSFTDPGNIIAWYCEFNATMSTSNTGQFLGPYTFIMPRTGSMSLFGKFSLGIYGTSISFSGNTYYTGSIICTTIVE